MIPITDDVPSKRFPIMNWLLIISNVLVFVFMLTSIDFANELVSQLGIVPKRFLFYCDIFEVATIFTSMFLHGGFAHIFSNMLALYIFGDNVEDRLGHFGYLFFYLLSGVGAAAVHIYLNQNSIVPTIGASGAISGVMAAYVLMYPRANVLVVFPILFIPFTFVLPSIVYIGVWFLSQLFNGALSIVSNVEAFGGVAWWAHVGGFLSGAFLLPFFLVKRSRKKRTYFFLTIII